MGLGVGTLAISESESRCCLVRPCRVGGRVHVTVSAADSQSSRMRLMKRGAEPPDRTRVALRSANRRGSQVVSLWSKCSGTAEQPTPTTRTRKASPSPTFHKCPLIRTFRCGCVSVAMLTAKPPVMIHSASGRSQKRNHSVIVVETSVATVAAVPTPPSVIQCQTVSTAFTSHRASCCRG